MAIDTRNTFVQKNEKKHQIGRRGFLATALGGLSVAFVMPDAGRMFGLRADALTPTQLANSYVHIGTDGSITLMFGG